MNRTSIIIITVLTMGHTAISQIINIPVDQPTIQAGIDAALDGDTVLVAENTYFENIDFKGKAITVASHFLLDGDTSHISRTIIDGSQPANPDTASVVLMISGEDTTSVLCGFTVTNGEKGTLLNLRSKSYEAGGGILVYQSGGLICDNSIVNNYLGGEVTSIGAGICVYGSSVLKVIIRNNQIQSNYCGGYDDRIGGGVCIIGGNLILECFLHLKTIPLFHFKSIPL